jgi:hypothetical protein
MAELLFEEIGNELANELGPDIGSALSRAKEKLPAMLHACTLKLNGPVEIHTNYATSQTSRSNASRLEDS